MTKTAMNLFELLKKHNQGDFVRTVAKAALQSDKGIHVGLSFLPQRPNREF